MNVNIEEGNTKINKSLSFIIFFRLFGGLYSFVVPLKAGDIKTHSSVRLSVTKTLTWLMSSEVLTIEH